MDRKWKFIAAPRSRSPVTSWSWSRCRDGVAIQESRGRFDDFASCVFDASVNGYARGDAFEVIKDRRKSRRFLATVVEP